MSDNFTQLVCPDCHSENLATIETILGSALGGATVDLETGEREFDHAGETVVHWDSSTSVGVECRDCGWEQRSIQEPGAVALDELVIHPDDDSAQMRLDRLTS